MLSLTAKGRKAYAQLDSRSREEVAGMLGGLAGGERERLVGAMQTVESLLEKKSSAEDAISLRAHRPGDIGWVVSRHGALYAAEYGWDERFEALVAEIAARFINRFEPQRERCWIAELDGEPRGLVFSGEASARRWRSCACCWSSRARAAAGWAGAWCASASPSRARRATASWCCGRSPTWPRRARSTRRRASGW